MALSADKLIKRAYEGNLKSGLVAADAVIYLGALLCWDTDGYLVPAAATSGYAVAGTAEEAVDNTGGDDGDLSCVFRWGHEEEFVTASLVQADIGKNCFVSDDATVDDAATNGTDIKVGHVSEIVDATHVRVVIRDFAASDA